MSHIIDLKNGKTVKPKPQNGPGFAVPARRVQTEAQPADRSGFAIRQNRLQNLEKNETLNSGVISWSAQPDRQPNLRLIFTASLGLFVIATLVQIFDGNLITTVFFALLGAMLLLNAKIRHGIGYFEINPLGVRTDEKLLGYREIKSFWIEYDPTLGIKEISLQLKKWYMPYVKIPLGGQNPVQIRSVLIDFLPEVEHKDSLVEILSRRLGI